MESFQFMVTTTFHVAALGSTYCEGLTYTVRPGNEKLAAHVKEWIADGRAVMIPGAVPSAISGVGTVSDAKPKLGWLDRVKSWL